MSRLPRKLLDHLNADLVKSSKQTECRLKEQQAVRKGEDSAAPYHPLFNPTQAERLQREVRELELQQRKRFQPHWDEVVRRIKAKEFRTRREVDEAYRKKRGWATALIDVALTQGVFTRDEAVSYFCGSSRRPSQYNPRLTSARRRPTNTSTEPVTRETFERVFRDKLDCLSFDLVVRLLRLGAWKAPQELARDFRKDSGWSQRFRMFLIRERLLTAEEWRACFSATPWRAIAEKYVRERDAK